jgi:para-aminobenzoate synthetase/4-amino-4-deoxychorismate lyase
VDARARVRILAAPDGALEVTGVPEPPPPGLDVPPLRLAPFVLPGGLGAHKWRDRRLLEALSALAPGTVPLLIEHDGTVLEAAYANVWLASGGALLTPPADGRLLPGVRRAELLAGTPGAREEHIDLDRLRAADAIFITSAIARRRARLA